MNVNRDYESLFLPWTKSIKRGNCDFLSHNSDFFPPKMAVLYLVIVSLHPTIFCPNSEFTSRIFIIFPPEILDT